MEKSLSLTDFQGSLSPIDSSSAWKKKRNKSFGTLLTLDDLSHLPFERHQSTPASFAHDEGIGNSDASFDQLSLLSQFELRLGIEVEDTLRRASEHVGGDRAASLEDLYHNVCIRIEDSVRARLQQSEPEREIPEYYFQLLANFFADNPYGSAMVSHFHRYWMSLWSHEIFPAVFSLLFGKWLFQNLPTASTPLASHVIVYISGVNRVLWNDVQSDRRMFRTVYNQLSEVVKSLELQLRLPPRLRLDLQNLCFRFYFHYEDPANIRAFLQSLPDVADPATYGLKNGGHGWGSRHDSVDSADGNSSVTSFDSEAEEPKLSDVMEGELVDTPRSEPPNLTALASITQPIGGVVHSRETNPKRTRLLRRTSHARAQTIALDENANPKTLVRSQSESAKTEIPRKPSGLSDSGDADGSAETHAALARAANEFVCEVMTTLRNISKESSLLRYLRNILHLSGLPLSASTASRLQAALYKYITPGGPLYPTRRVRHTARQVMDELFPGGKFARTLVSTIFRLTHPFQWPRSLLYWCLTIVLARVVFLVESTPVTGLLFRTFANTVRWTMNCLGCRRVVAVVEGFYNVHVGSLKDRRERIAQRKQEPIANIQATVPAPVISSWASYDPQTPAMVSAQDSLPKISLSSRNSDGLKPFLPTSANGSPQPGLELTPDTEEERLPHSNGVMIE